MDNEKKEKLIEMVRQYECLYDLKNKEYKNVLYKTMVWEKIGATIGVQGPVAKNAWRTLRDGYIRHRKVLKGTTGSAKKYSRYTWSAQMSFLDGSFESRATGSNITQPTRPAQSPSAHRELGSCIGNDTGLENTLRHLHNVTSNTTFTEPPSPEDQQLSQSPPPPQQSRSSPTQPSPHLPKRKPTSKSNVDSDNAEKVLAYLKNKKEHDSVDLLFMSYAKTFKTLPISCQCRMKIKLAKMFAEAEASAQFDQAEHLPQPEVVNLSPTYTTISDVPYQIDYIQEINEADDIMD